MGRRLLLLGFLLCAACGDDDRVGPRAPVPPRTPQSGGPAAPPDAPSVPPPPREDVGGDAWAGTRPGDWATWEIRVDGADAKTRLTWRATKVEGTRVEYDVTSRTSAADGKVLASHDFRAVHSGGADALHRRGTPTRQFVVGPARVSAGEDAYDAPQGKISVWSSADVPFHGLVASKGGGVEQTLIAFERAP